MRRSNLFPKPRREAPADETTRNAQLLIRAGFIHKEMAGVYSYLPLGRRVLEAVIQIIREEMDAVGGQELTLSSLQPQELWEKSGRWHDEEVDIWFKTRLHGKEGWHRGPELGLANTHEETLTALMKGFISSYKDLPIYAYQFQTKFRNEPRAKSGLLRCREFIMKDLYSFCRDQTEHDAFYKKAEEAYRRVFERVGLGDSTYLTFASGGSFAKFSHEFQTVTDVGEDTIFVHEAKKLAINQEVMNDETLAMLGIKKQELVEKKAVEVGNIFTLGTRFSEALGLNFVDQTGQPRPVFMGSYGIGPGRLIGTMVEHFADDKGLVWPEAVAPFRVYLACLGDSTQVRAEADKIYQQLVDDEITVLYDDRDGVSAGEMFADADLMGMPHRLVISQQTIEAGAYELKGRSASETGMVSFEELHKTLGNT